MLIGAFTNWLDLSFLQHVFKIKWQELIRNNEYVTKYYGDEKLPQYLLRLLFVLKRNMQRYLVQLLTCHEWDLLFLFYVHYLLRMLWHRRIESTNSTLIYLNFFMKYVAQLSEDAGLSWPGWGCVCVLTCKKRNIDLLLRFIHAPTSCLYGGCPTHLSILSIAFLHSEYLVRLIQITK